MNVLEHNHDGSLARNLLQQPAKRPRRVFRGGGARCGTDRAHDTRDHDLAVVDSRERSSKALVAPERKHDLAERPERDLRAVRQAAAHKHHRIRSSGELGDEAGFTDPGGAEDRDQPAFSLRCDSAEGDLEGGELLHSSYERPIETRDS